MADKKRKEKKVPALSKSELKQKALLEGAVDELRSWTSLSRKDYGVNISMLATSFNPNMDTEKQSESTWKTLLPSQAFNPDLQDQAEINF